MPRFNQKNIVHHVATLRLAELRDYARRSAEINAIAEAIGFDEADRHGLEGEEAREFRDALNQWMFGQVYEFSRRVDARKLRAA
jgi:predicted homoserine dehydrogenase-like protein